MGKAESLAGRDARWYQLVMSSGGVAESLDSDQQADLVAHRRNVLGHAELRALDTCRDVGAAGLALVEGVGRTVEAGQGQGHRFADAEQGQGAFGGHRLVAFEAELVGLEADHRKLGGVEETFTTHVLVPLGKAHVDGGRVDAHFHRPLAGGVVEDDLAAGLVEAAALGGKAQMVRLEEREGVVAVDGVADGGSQGRGGAYGQQGEDLFQAVLLGAGG